MRQKIIFFDIDGTLVDAEDHSIAESTAAAIDRAKRLGHLLYINSGRPLTGIDPRVKAMGFHGYACGCGLYIQSRDQVLYHHRLDKQLQLKLVETVRRYQLQVMYEGAEHVYFDLSRPLAAQVKVEKEYYAAMGLDTQGDPSSPQAEFDKLVVWTHPGADINGFAAAVSPWFDVIDREGTLVELVPHGCSKGAAMDRLLAYHGMSREDCIAIGDSTNDLSMLEAAGISIAMGSGDPRIFSGVTWVTDHIRRDGIAKALSRFGVI